MRRLALAAMVALLAGPALANAREDSEAKLAALARTIIPALGAALPQPEGMTCAPARPDPSPTNRLLIPNWRGECRWQQEGEEMRASVLLLLSQSLAVATRREILDRQAQAGGDAADRRDATFAGTPAPLAMRSGATVKAAPSAHVVALVEARGTKAAAGLDRLATAMAAMDAAALEARPDVQMHVLRLAEHRRLLEAQIAGLAAVLPPSRNGRDPTARPAAAAYPDHMFFGFEPLVQADVVEAGVTMTVTLTTSSFALENAEAEGLFALRNGRMGARGVLNDRGRVKVFLQETGLTAVIDGRAMLMLHVPEAAPGTDPLAAMEAVLARIAATDFSGY